MKTYSQALKDYEIRQEMHEGRKHMVVPVVMMVEGVHSGSKGAVLHTAEELGKIVSSWNGIPITINHPQQDDNFVSANSPIIIDTQTVGRVYNAKMQDNKLIAEAWLDEEKLNIISPAAMVYITEKHPLDVSVGVFSEDEAVEGDYNNEHYTAIATNYRPDHLALLPGGVGACSWSDGCGIRVNKKGGQVNEMNEEQIKLIKEQALLSINEQSLFQTVDLLRSKVDSMDDSTKYHILENIFESYMIYEVRNKRGEVMKDQYFKQNYQILSNNEVEFIGSPIPVKKKVEYITVERINNNQKQVNMADDKKPCGGCMEKVIALINNEATNFTSADREWLLTQDEAILDKLLPKEPVKAPEPVQVNAEQAMEVLKNSLKNEDDFINLLPEKMKDSMRSGLALHEEMRSKMIETIVTHTEGVWDKKELEVMNTNVLKKIHDSISVPVDYSLNNSSPSPVVNAADEVLAAPGIVLT